MFQFIEHLKDRRESHVIVPKFWECCTASSLPPAFSHCPSCVGLIQRTGQKAVALHWGHCVQFLIAPLRTRVDSLLRNQKRGLYCFSNKLGFLWRSLLFAAGMQEAAIGKDCHHIQVFDLHSSAPQKVDVFILMVYCPWFSPPNTSLVNRCECRTTMNWHFC